MANQQTTQSRPLFPPVVAVLGHVDHGKTTLLDAIRKTNIAEREHGGITQKIGASTVEVSHEGDKRMITFIDTPGHEIFSQMRGRGAQVADIVLLIVSAVDGVMPQTKESIKILQATKTPFIVVLTKTDLPEKNPEKVKQQLLREHVSLEGYGGDVPVIEVSSKTGYNIKELLDLILLVFELKQDTTKKIDPEQALYAVVIESKQDPKTGPKATIVIKNGSVAVRQELVADTAQARVRAILTDHGEQLPSATVGQAVEVLGFEQVPAIGSIVYHKQQNPKQMTTSLKQPKTQAPEASLSLFLCADTQGSLEAIQASLPENVHVVVAKTGEISEGDILFAKSTGAIILTFNIKLKQEMQRFAINEKVLLKNYTIIYELLDELKDVIEGKRLALLEQIYGVARVLASFPYEKSIVLGIAIQDGRIARGDKVRLMRGDEIVGESQIVSLRQGKNAVSKVEKGKEAGIIIAPALDFESGDIIVAHS